MKAISPMIAVILLIAFTVAIGGILSVWLSGLVSTQTSTVSSGSDKQIKCAGSALRISEVRYPSSPTSGRGSVNVSVIYDTGTEVLSNISVEVSGKGIVDSATSTGTVVPGEGRALTFTANFPPDLVSARGLCQSNVPVVAECKSGQPCMKSG